MSTKRDSKPAPVKGATRTDLFLTKTPRDTPRGRLHHLAAVGLRTAQEAFSTIGVIDQKALEKLRRFSQRGIAKLLGDGSFGAQVIKQLCHNLDLAAAMLSVLGSVDIVAVCDGLTITLVQLEVAENTIGRLKKENDTLSKELRLERDHNSQLRTMLAEEQVRVAAALRDVPEENWNEITRNSSLSETEVRLLSEPVPDDPDPFG